jgi:endonuclease/exonuclease/phosphatase family metal-dependent hydrolase
MAASKTRTLLLLIWLTSGLALLSSCDSANFTSSHAVVTGEAGDYQFCFWNVENLFDDHADTRPNEADKKYDEWFAADAGALKLKLAHLSDALLHMNDGRGPDIIALAEVENERAATLITGALNARIADRSQHYESILFKDPAGGRHIATTIITRLPVRGDKTRLLGRRLRILEGHLSVNGHDLVIVASHWTSRVSDKTGEGREKYADQIYGAYKAMHISNPKVDFLVCGDFNDPPDAPSVRKHLHATGNRDEVLRSTRDAPLLYNVMDDKDPVRFGTHYYHGMLIFDQIAISPGMMDDQGWTCRTDTVQTINSLVRPGDKAKRPWAFGNQKEKHERGYSDHFPVTVRLKVQK